MLSIRFPHAANRSWDFDSAVPESLRSAWHLRRAARMAARLEGSGVGTLGGAGGGVGTEVVAGGGGRGGGAEFAMLALGQGSGGGTLVLARIAHAAPTPLPPTPSPTAAAAAIIGMGYRNGSPQTILEFVCGSAKFFTRRTRRIFSFDMFTRGVSASTSDSAPLGMFVALPSLLSVMMLIPAIFDRATRLRPG